MTHRRLLFERQCHGWSSHSRSSARFANSGYNLRALVTFLCKSQAPTNQRTQYKTKGIRNHQEPKNVRDERQKKRKREEGRQRQGQSNNHPPSFLVFAATLRQS